MRESKLKLEMVAARREEMDFKARVEEGEKFEAMVARKGGVKKYVGDKDDKDIGTAAGGGFKKRKFRQTSAIKEERTGKKGKKEQIDRSVLNMLAK